MFFSYNFVDWIGLKCIRKENREGVLYGTLA